MILFIMLCIYLIRLYLEGLNPKTSNFSKPVEFNSKINKFKRTFSIFVVLLCGYGISVIEKLVEKDLQTISTIELLSYYSLLLFVVLLGVLTFPEWIVDYGESKDIDGFSHTMKIA